MWSSIGTEAVTPVVLVGGASRRFGLDKLRYPWGGSWLVDRPIAALRAVLGSRVALVGRCDPAVAARGDAVIEDRYPGVGPAGGILSALEATGTSVVVLPGDVPDITPTVVEAILGAARVHERALAVLARGTRVEPCIGLYRPRAAGVLRARLERGESRLHDAFSTEEAVTVEVAAEALRNVNTLEDLGGG